VKGTTRTQGETRVKSRGGHSSASDLPSLLNQAAEALDGIGPAFDSRADRLRALLRRLQEEQFHLAVLGQFKRGKSTLLNALLGEEVLPSSVIPVTAVPTFIRAGGERRARVSITGGRDIETDAVGPEDLREFLSHYVTEEANPANRLGVCQVEVMHPAPILRDGLVLIDTPGIGSTHRHNTEATLNFIPQCDAALFVMSPDPPVTEVEIDFLKEVRTRIGRVFFVLTKSDYLVGSEKHKMLEFLSGVLHEKAGVDPDAPIVAVSARLGLEARRECDERKWAESGMREIEDLLLDFVAHDKESALVEAVAGKASDELSDALLELRLSIQSLRMPLEELENQLRALKSILSEADLRRTAEKDTLEGDRKRMAALLEEQAEQLRKKARKRFVQVVKDALEEHNLDTGAAQEALAEAIPGFFERELGEMSRAFENEVRQAVDRHRARAAELIESVRRAAAQLFDVRYQPQTSKQEFEVKRRPYWVTHHWPASLGIVPEGLWDKLLPRGMRKSRVLRRLCERLEVLVSENVENVRWPTLQNLDKSFREFGDELDRSMEEAISATKGAIEAAYEKRRARSAKLADETARLESKIAQIEEIHAQLRGCCGSAKAA